MRRLLLALALIVPGLAWGQPSGPALSPRGDASNTTVTATGGTVARTAAAIASDVVNVKSFGALANGSDDAGAFAAALLAIQSSPSGGALYIPCGDYTLSSGFSATVGANQRISVKTDGPSCVRLHFTNASAAGFAFTMQPVTGATWISNGPSVAVDSLACVSDWSTITAQSCVSVASAAGNSGATPATYSRPLPPAVAISHITTISKTNSGGFLHAVSLTDVAVSHFEDVWMWASTSDTTANAVQISGTAPTATGLLLNRIRQQSGGTALVVTDYIQGVYVSDMQTVGTQHSISWTNSGGYTGADNLIVTKSQLNSKLSEVVTSGVAHIQVYGNYLLGNTAGWVGADITGGSDHILADNDVVSTVASDTTSIGYKLTNVSGAAITGGAICGPVGASPSGAPIVLAGSSTRVHGAGLTVCAGTILGIDGSSAPATNGLTDSRLGGLMIPAGWTGGDRVGLFGPSTGASQANTISSSAKFTMLSGEANTLSTNCYDSQVAGFANTCNAQGVSVNGSFNTAQAALTRINGSRGASPYIGCEVEANSYQQIGGAQHIVCSGQVQATGPSTAVRATLDGTTTAANYNTFGLNSFGTGTTTAAMEITIAAASPTVAAGTYKMPLGQLAYNTSSSPTTVWTGGSPIALGTAFGVGITADTTNASANIQITNPSSLAAGDKMTYTVTWRATIVRSY